MAEVAKVLERKRRSVSPHCWHTAKNLSINLEDLWELQKILDGTKGSPPSNGGKCKSLGPYPEDGAGLGQWQFFTRELSTSTATLQKVEKEFAKEFAVVQAEME